MSAESPEAAESVESTETAEAAPTKAAVPDVAAESEERHRLTVLAASGPLILLLAPMLLPLDDTGPILRLADRDPGVFALFVLLFAWPLLVGVVGLVRGRTRKAPGTALFAVPAVAQMLATLGLGLMLVQVLDNKRRARESIAIWAACALCAFTLYVLGRGFRRTGWTRFAQVIAGTWLVFFTGTLIVGSQARDLFDPPMSGGWVLLFALSAAAPAVGWLVSRRRGR